MDDFINQLITDVKLPENTEPEVREQLTENLKQRAERMVLSRLLDSMSEEQLDEFDKLTNQNPEDATALQKYIEDNVPNKDAVVAAALAEFRLVFLGKNI